MTRSTEPATKVMRRQCKKCPWKISTDPRTIPNGYDEERHRRLSRTIARVDSPNEDAHLRITLRMMACHETPVGREKPCVGWLHNQLTDGDNIVLRYLVVLKRISADFVIDGPQHATLADTFPK